MTNQPITEINGMRVGDVVALKSGITPIECGEPKHMNATGKIDHFLTDIEGGVYIPEGLGGCRYWNVSDLKRVVPRD